MGRRGSSGPSNNRTATTENKDRVALDISLLKKQYDKLRERQRQAHIILTTTARQTVNPSNSANSLPVNQYLIGRNAIVSSKGRRIGPPMGSIPPARKIPVAKLAKLSPKQVKRTCDTLHWKDTESSVRRKNSLTWKECNNESKREADLLKNDDEEHVLQRSPSATSSLSSISESSAPTSRKKSESSSYSEDSDGNSSTSTSLCDDENIDYINAPSIEASPLRKINSTTLLKSEDSSSHLDECIIDTLNKLYTFNTITDSFEEDTKNVRSKDSVDEISIEKSKIDIKSNSNSSLNKLFHIDDNHDDDDITINDQLIKTLDSSDDVRLPITTITNYFESDVSDVNKALPFCELSLQDKPCSSKDISAAIIPLEYSDTITSTSQLSPIADISKYLSTSSISPLRTPSSFMDFSDLISASGSSTFDAHSQSQFDFQVNDEGVTNQYFERINVPERPSRLELRDQIDDTLIRGEQDTNTSASICSPKVVNLTPFDSPKISPNKSALIHSVSTENFDKTKYSNEAIIHENSPEKYVKESINDDVETHQFSDRINYLKEKSFSLDEPQKFVKPVFRPTSCPETGINIINYQKKNSDRASKIIEENSMILHRILKKNISIGDVEESFENKPNVDMSLSDVQKCIDNDSQIEDKYINNTLLLSNVHQIFETDDFSKDKSKTDSEISYKMKLSELNKSMNDLKSSLELVQNDIDTDKSFEFMFPAVVLSKSIEDLHESLEIKSSEYNKFLMDSNATCYENDNSKEEMHNDKNLIETNTDNIKNNIDTCTDSPSDISETLSSIKNTIKSIDSLCQNDFVSKSFRKTQSSLDSGEPTNFSLYQFPKSPTENTDPIKQIDVVDISTKTNNTTTTTPTLCVEQVSDNVVNRNDLSKSQPKIIDLMADINLSPSKLSNSSADRSLLTLHTNRLSRDYKREISPRRRRDDEREEYESRAQRDRSPSLLSKTDDVLPQVKSLDKDFTNIDSSLSNCTNNIIIAEQDYNNSSFGNANKYLSLSDYVYKSSYDDNNKLNSSLNISTYKSHESKLNTMIDTEDIVPVPVKTNFSDKLSIRHTTVTATFYDRYMSQKLERNSKLDKSPSSPIITKAYLDTLKPPVTIDRNSKSAENSPSRTMFDINTKDIDDEKCMSLPTVTNYHIKSCDNISEKIGNKFTPYISSLANNESTKLLDLKTELDLYENIPKISP